jgi:hypothetical protein
VSGGGVVKSEGTSRNIMKPKSDEEWPFDQAPNVTAITTRQVLELGYSILQVTHYEDDHSWAFLCGTTENDDEDARLICMAEALHLDKTLRAVADLSLGQSAWRRDKESDWTIYPEENA